MFALACTVWSMASTLMINHAREGFCQGIYVLIVIPWPAVPSTLMPLPSRSALLWNPTVLNIIFLLLTAVLV